MELQELCECVQCAWSVCVCVSFSAGGMCCVLTCVVCVCVCVCGRALLYACVHSVLCSSCSCLSLSHAAPFCIWGDDAWIMYYVLAEARWMMYEA